MFCVTDLLEGYNVLAQPATTVELLVASALCPILIYLLFKRLSVIGQFRRHHEMFNGNDSTKQKVVLITGADSGFGHQAGIKLVEQGYCVFAGCLNAENAAATETFRKLKLEHGSSFHVLQLDITSCNDIEAAVTKVSAWLAENPGFYLYAIVSNAGITYPMAPLEICSFESIMNVFNVNIFGALRVIKAFVPLMRQASKRDCRIVVMASLIGEFTCPMMGAYCASKWALIAISDTLRYELCPFGIGVSVVMPDLYKTELVTNKSVLHQSLAKELCFAESSVVKAYGGQFAVERMRFFIEMMEQNANPNLKPVLDCIAEAVNSKHPKKRYYPISWKSSLVTTFARWFPSLIDNMVMAGQIYQEPK